MPQLTQLFVDSLFSFSSAFLFQLILIAAHLQLLLFMFQTSQDTASLSWHTELGGSLHCMLPSTTQVQVVMVASNAIE